jgi:hypothetical protein
MSHSSQSPRETIQISLGPSANAITAHLLNLQGLAATSSDGSFCSSCCDPLVTHYVSRSQQTWVPRVLMIDEATPTVSLENEASPTSFLESSLMVPWKGPIQVLGDASAIHNNNNNPFWKTASTLAYSPYSRYHAHETSSAHQSHYRAHADNPRHVVWDDDEDEETFRRQQEVQEYTRCRQEQAREEWKTQTAVSLGNELEALGHEQYSHGDKVADHWTDIWMPPFAQDSNVVLPYSHRSQLVPHWDVAYSTAELPFLQDWKEHVLMEGCLRRLLEPCDYGIQGAILTTEGCGMYASLTGMILEELQDECKSASRWVHHVVTTDSNKKENSDGDSKNSWQEFQVARVRQHISAGLALYDFTEKAHAVLPLRLDASSTSLFRASAQIAMALEACGLPFRFEAEQSKRQNSYKMGLQNAPFLAQGGADTSWGSTASRLSMTEYLSMLQPSSQYSLLELDVLPQSMNGSALDNESLYNAIREGTSVERDQRMRQRGEEGLRGRPRDVMPGAWLQGTGNDRGLLSSLSYSTEELQTMDLNRSVHHHFALSTAVRPQLVTPTRDNDGIPMSDYLTCLVQGMGIRYRPERSMATILDQTLGRLTFAQDGGGSLYGAGIYWKHLLPSVDTPVVAVLGNTTRAFGLLNRIATDVKSTIRSSKFHGYVTRDVMNGVLPELDDCEEALEGCWDKRDLYHPPEGNGFEEDDNLEF